MYTSIDVNSLNSNLNPNHIVCIFQEAEARSVMFHIHLGDTPNTLKDDDFVTLGEKRCDPPSLVDTCNVSLFGILFCLAESNDDVKCIHLLSKGCSGSDISVITREALMEPLRLCQVRGTLGLMGSRFRVMPVYLLEVHKSALLATIVGVRSANLC